MNVVRILSKLFMMAIYVMLFCFLQSCGQDSNKSTKVTFKLPILNKTTMSKLNSQKVSTYSSTSDAESNSKTFFPNTINDINCYAVIVSGPELNLSKSSCNLKKFETIAGSNLTTSATVKTQTFGILNGRVFQGNTISLDVPAGSDRVFHLIGFQATDSASCVPIASGEDDSQVSQPYLLASSSSINLEPGSEVTVPIQLPVSGTILASNNLFIDTDSCVGPDVPNNNSNKTSIYSAMTIDKISYPAGNLQASGTCNTISIKFRDQNGQQVALPNNENLAINALVTNASNTTSVSSTFFVYANDGCYGTPLLSTSSTLVVSSGTSEKKLSFFSASPGYETSYTFAVKSDILQNIFQSPSMLNANLASSTTQLYGPTKILPDTCYHYLIAEKNILGKLLTLTTSFTVLSKSNSNLNFYSDNSCSTQLTVGNYFNSLSTSPTQDIYAKFTNSLINEPILIQTGSTNGMQIINQQKIVIGKGDNTFDHIHISSPDYLYAHQSDLSCFGPYFVSFENNYGTNINISSATVMISSSNTNMTIKSTCAYSLAASSPTTVLWNSVGETITNNPGIKFYLYYPISGTAYVSSTLTFITYLPSLTTAGSVSAITITKPITLQVGN